MQPSCKTPSPYNSRWRKARETFLAQHPLCVMCQKDGGLTPAMVVDHIQPHRGDSQLFWDSSNWQPLCKRCHDSDKQMLEKSGEVRNEFTEDGRIVW